MMTANLEFCDERKSFTFASKIVHDDACHPMLDTTDISNHQTE